MSFGESLEWWDAITCQCQLKAIYMNILLEICNSRLLYHEFWTNFLLLSKLNAILFTEFQANYIQDDE